LLANVRPVTVYDTQLLRYWRNQDYVRKYMLNPTKIQSSEQIDWFLNIDSDTQKHFIYSHGYHDVGTCNLTKINRSEKTFESGVICGNTEFQKHPINIYSCLWLYDYAFNQLSLVSGTVNILRSNKRAIKLNKALGFKETSISSEEVMNCQLTKIDHLVARVKFIKFLRTLDLWR